MPCPYLKRHQRSESAIFHNARTANRLSCGMMFTIWLQPIKDADGIPVELKVLAALIKSSIGRPHPFVIKPDSADGIDSLVVYADQSTQDRNHKMLNFIRYRRITPDAFASP